jgi:hypothetical protein
VLVSVDRVKSGQPLAEIVAHERAHAVLIRNTELGWVLNTLATFGLHPWPARDTRERCYALLNVLTNATRWTEEGLATFLTGLSVEDGEYPRYRGRQPAMYLRAASELDWLRQRGLDAQAQADVAIMLASLASGPPVLERWGRDRLTDVRRAQAWFDEPVNRPDARFPAVCRALAVLGDAELVHLAADAEAAQAAAGRLVRLAGVGPAFRLLPHDTRLEDVMRIVRAVTAPLLDDPTLPADERHRLAEAVRVPQLAVRGLASSRMAILMTRTRGAVGRHLRDPGPRDLMGYDLATVQDNASFDVEPGLTPSGADPVPLLPREAVCYFSGPGRPPLAATFSAFAFLDWLDALDDSVTLAVLDTSYLTLGMPVPALPALAGRRHVVLVGGRTPHDLVLDVAASYDERATVLVTVNASDLVGVSYVMLRRDGAPSPVILLPTVAETARETVATLTGHRQGPRVPPRRAAGLLPVPGGRARRHAGHRRLRGKLARCAGPVSRAGRRG